MLTEPKIITATYKCDHEKMIALCNKGVDLEETFNLYDGMTALMIAAKKGDETAVRILVNAGAKLDTTTEYDNKTAIYIAVENGRINCVKLLIELGANMDIKAKDVYFYPDQLRTPIEKAAHLAKHLRSIDNQLSHYEREMGKDYKIYDGIVKLLKKSGAKYSRWRKLA